MADEHVKVAVRLRPLSQDERAATDVPVLSKARDGSLQVSDPSGLSGTLSFNAVFDETASNSEVFNVVLKDMLEQALQGKNATLFAYGQTGSGKTHTIEGVMNIAADYLFDAICETPSREFLLRLSAVEVYNEAVHDLLQREPTRSRLDLAEGKNGKLVVKNLCEESLLAASHLHSLLKQVKGNRKVRETYFNVNSSRSHQVVTLIVESRYHLDRPASLCARVEKGSSDAATRKASSSNCTSATSADMQSMHATITFVDLAGSEPSAQVLDHPNKIQPQKHHDHQRKRESAKINQSLLSLGRVIQLLADKPARGGYRPHIPFRDSNLTRLLQPCLGGNSTMAIIGTVSPGALSLEDTKATLNFIRTAAKVTMRPQVNLVDSNQSRIRGLEEEVRLLRKELAVKEAPLSPLGGTARTPEIGSNAATAFEVESRLQAQLQQNQELLMEKETLARKIAGLERLLLNADAGWRPSTARSIDMDNLPSQNPIDPPSPAASTMSGSRRSSAVTQSMPTFHRSELQRATGETGAASNHMEAGETTPARLWPGALPNIPEGRPNTAAPGTRIRPVAPNPRTMPSPNNLDCYLSPDIRAALHFEEAPVPPTLTTTPVAWTSKVAAPRAVPEPSMSYVPPAHTDAEEPAVKALQQEYRNAKFAGPPNEDSVHIRLARLEMQLRTLQGSQERDRSNAQRDGLSLSVTQADLQGEIDRLKAGEQRRLDALSALAVLENHIKQLAAQAVEVDPGETPAEEIHTMVRKEQLPDWVGQALTNASEGSGAIAPAHEDAGEVVTSREKPVPDITAEDMEGAAGPCEHSAIDNSCLPRLASDAHSALRIHRIDSSTGDGGSGKEGNTEIICDSRMRTSEQRRSLAHSQRPAARQGMEGAHLASAASHANSATTSMRSHASCGSGSAGNPDDELKAIMVRAVNGMKAQEAQRFKLHMRTLQAKWKASTEKHVAHLQGVVNEYQDALEGLERQKKWLMGRVFEAEVQLEASECARLQAEALVQERDAAIADLDARVHRLKSQVLGTTSLTLSPANLEARSFVDTAHSAWGELPSVRDLLPSILQLWHELHVPLLTRAQFVIAHQGKDVFYYMAEHGHLLDLQRDLGAGTEAIRGASLELHRERQWLGARLKQVYTDLERVELFRLWNITQIKERKKALALRLWDPIDISSNHSGATAESSSSAQVTEKDGGVKASAELTLALYGWGGDTSLAGVSTVPLARRPNRHAIGARPSRIAARATSLLTPRTHSRANSSAHLSNWDDASSTVSMPLSGPSLSGPGPGGSSGHFSRP